MTADTTQRIARLTPLAEVAARIDALVAPVAPREAALANAIFDATGIRLRQAPFTPERLKPGLA